MQKIYVLLRNDQQTGPYSLPEIIHFDLKAHDLIWIEGRSAGWYYPQEIAALRPYLSFLPKDPTPVVNAQPTAEPVLAAQAPVVEKEPKSGNDLPPAFNRVVAQPVEKPVKPAAQLEAEIYAQFRPTPEQKTGAATTAPARKPVNAVLVGAVTVLIVGGVFAASWLLNRKPADLNEPTVMQQAAPGNEMESNEPPGPAVDEATETTATVLKNNKANQPSRAVNPLPVRQTESTQQQAIEKAESGTYTAAEEEKAMPPANGDNEAAVPAEKTDAPAETASAPEEKKKSLREKFLDLFKKKPEEKTKEATPPAETAGGERNASRRESGASLAQLVQVRFDVPNNWMMGIRGAKATLVNRSSQTINKAVVDVQYYDEENNLLQTKTITFSKVEARETKTSPIPDHPSATKVDYRVVSAEGRPAA